MPRRARLILPNVPLHVTQRGVNRAAIFIDDEDRQVLRRCPCSFRLVLDCTTDTDERAGNARPSKSTLARIAC